VFEKVATLGGILAQKNEHPLANPRELRRIVSELPKDNAFKDQDEITGWLESLAGIDDFPADRLYEVILAFEEAAQPHLKRLSREYFQAARLSRSEEKRLWSINYGFWSLLAGACERCLNRLADKGRPGVPVRTMAGLLMLQHTFGLSDEQLMARWVENPYYQSPSIGQRFCAVLPFARGSRTWGPSAGSSSSATTSRWTPPRSAAGGRASGPQAPKCC
jgi:hypothetical protein